MKLASICQKLISGRSLTLYLSEPLSRFGVPRLREKRHVVTRPPKGGTPNKGACAVRAASLPRASPTVQLNEIVKKDALLARVLS